jgi:hypothetical protein
MESSAKPNVLGVFADCSAKAVRKARIKGRTHFINEEEEWGMIIVGNN